MHTRMLFYNTKCILCERKVIHVDSSWIEERTCTHQIGPGPCCVSLTSDDAVPCTGVARVTGEGFTALVCVVGSSQNSVSNDLGRGTTVLY
jgi:hypothetical protein